MTDGKQENQQVNVDGLCVMFLCNLFLKLALQALDLKKVPTLHFVCIIALLCYIVLYIYICLCVYVCLHLSVSFLFLLLIFWLFCDWFFLAMYIYIVMQYQT